MHNGAMLTPPTSKNIRVTVPVSPQVLARFKRLSQVAGQSVGRAMGEWLEGTQEGLDPMIAILEQHKSRPADAIRSLQDYAQTLDTVSGDLFDKVKNMDSGGGNLAAVAAEADAAVLALKRGLTPPSSNTGGKGRKTSSKTKGGNK
jgi:hypothetical protein